MASNPFDETCIIDRLRYFYIIRELDNGQTDLTGLYYKLLKPSMPEQHPFFYNVERKLFHDTQLVSLITSEVVPGQGDFRTVEDWVAARNIMQACACALLLCSDCSSEEMTGATYECVCWYAAKIVLPNNPYTYWVVEEDKRRAFMLPMKCGLT